MNICEYRWYCILYQAEGVPLQLKKKLKIDGTSVSKSAQWFSIFQAKWPQLGHKGKQRNMKLVSQRKGKKVTRGQIIPTLFKMLFLIVYDIILVEIRDEGWLYEDINQTLTWVNWKPLLDLTSNGTTDSTARWFDPPNGLKLIQSYHFSPVFIVKLVQGEANHPIKWNLVINILVNEILHISNSLTSTVNGALFAVVFFSFWS